MCDSFDGISERSILCRDEQLQTIGGLIRKSPCDLPSSLFVYGLEGTGKSLAVDYILRKRNICTCYANCAEFYSQKIIYETILNQVAGAVPNWREGRALYGACDNFAEFVLQFKKLVPDKEKRYAIVLEHSERLRDCDANLFPSLCRLQELCEDISVCVIFSSRIPLDKFRVPMGFLEPFVIHFPQYTKEELVHLLVSERVPCILSDESYKNYINLYLSVFFMATRSLPELKHLAELMLEAYCEPILKGETSEHDVRVLWKNIEPKFRKALTTVYLREVTSEQFQRMQELTDLDSKNPVTKCSMTKMELPFYSKFLLVAAYLASYNPPGTDKRFFTKNHGKKRKTQAMIKAKQKSSSQLVGPKPFPLDRLMAIFYSIIEDKVAPTAHLFSQITTLVSLRLLTVMGGDDPLGTPKYKSNVSLDFIRSVARTVNFDIVQYLYDYSAY